VRDIGKLLEKAELAQRDLIQIWKELFDEHCKRK
jgi:hypothetical protein